MIFWKLPNNKYLAFIPRTGSTAWGQAIIDNYYPEISIKQKRAITPDGELANPQYFIPNERNPKDGEMLAVLRDPIERFRSGFSRAAKGRTTDQLIADLLSGAENPVNIHIRAATDQFDRKVNSIKWYLYESGLEQLATDIGLPAVPDTANESNSEDKPVLTDSQVDLLREYYADDIILYNSL